MKTTSAELLVPYSDYLKSAYGKAADDGMRGIPVAAALILAEADHVADVRNARAEPFGGWKNALPLEHSTALGFFIKSCRTGDKTFILGEAQAHPDQKIRDIYKTLCNAENVYVAKPEGMTTDALLAYAETELYFYE